MIGNDMYNHEMPYYPTPYGLDNPDTSNFGAWGHFSQIVWKGTTGVGCATSYCATLQGATFTNYFTVCNYYPPGKLKPTSHPTYVDLTLSRKRWWRILERWRTSGSRRGRYVDQLNDAYGFISLLWCWI
jgi:hypothetical protein